MKESKEISVWRCGHCLKVYYKKEDADYCHSERKCDTCGKIIGKKDYYSDCLECRNKRQLEKEMSLFEVAKKIDFKQYEGYFLYDDDEHIIDGDDLADKFYDKIIEGREEELPSWLPSLKPQPVFNLNIYDIIMEKSEDGYEDMYDRLDTDDELLSNVQSLLDQWMAKQGDNINTYYEDFKEVVLLDELIKEIKSEIKQREELKKKKKKKMTTRTLYGV